MTSGVFVIVNPAAGRGKSLHRAAAFRACMADGEIAGIAYTQESGDEERLARRALEDSASVIVVVGGDGTFSGIANAVLRSGKRCQLAVVPSGTGNDVAKTLGIDGQTPQQIAALVSRRAAREIDVGLADDRYFVNSCGFGFAASVLEATRRVRFLRGDAVYIYSALRQLFSYRGISISIGASLTAEAARMLMLTVSNGKFLGGAFRIAPHASVIDGQLDIGFFGDAGLLGRVRIFASAFRGTHVGLPTVKTKRVSEMTLGFPAPPMMEVDGELRQALSSTVKIECVARALSVIAAPGFPG
jgi:diacylglycerol kinase (ATP)